MKRNYGKEGVSAVEMGDTLMGLHCFEQISDEKLSPLELSYFAYCVARERRAGERAKELLTMALQAGGSDPLVYLNMGRVYQVAGAYEKAVESFRRGMKIQPHRLLLNALEGACSRRTPLLPFLGRHNPLNILCGKFVTKLSN